MLRHVATALAGLCGLLAGRELAGPDPAAWSAGADAGAVALAAVLARGLIFLLGKAKAKVRMTPTLWLVCALPVFACFPAACGPLSFRALDELGLRGEVQGDGGAVGYAPETGLVLRVERRGK